MQKSAVVALALLESASAFQAPAMKVSTRAVGATMFAEGDTGVTPPLGVYDPLGLIETKDMRRFEIMEIKHGRAAMLGFLHIVLIHAGVRLPGYLSIVQGARTSTPLALDELPPAAAVTPAPRARLPPRSLDASSRPLSVWCAPSRLPIDLKFSDMPVGCLASLEATPTLGWLQIMAVTCAAETGYAGTDSGLVSQADDKAPGDIGGAKWKRYSDPAERAFKLNAERNNGRAAMLGVTGCIIHELLGVDALFPTGGMGGAAPPAIL